MLLNFVGTIENIFTVPLVHQGRYGFTNARESLLPRGNLPSVRGEVACGSVHEHRKREKNLCQGGIVEELIAKHMIVLFVF